jgi:hypothetical protein
MAKIIGLLRETGMQQRLRAAVEHGRRQDAHATVEFVQHWADAEVIARTHGKGVLVFDPWVERVCAIERCQELTGRLTRVVLIGYVSSARPVAAREVVRLIRAGMHDLIVSDVDDGPDLLLSCLRPVIENSLATRLLAELPDVPPRIARLIE